MSTRRSASVGALPLEKKHFVSRNESSSGITLDVRCACQYFQSDSLLPERINPVDSRPGSKLDFHHDPQCSQVPYDEGRGGAGGMGDRNVNSPPLPFQPMLDRRLMAGDRVMQPEPERLSMRGVGKHRSWDQASASVDISFVEKYPELEETARSRGLVVRSISRDDPHSMPGMQRQRFTSVDRMSTASGYRDPDTMSMHSVRSLRRISRSPSKQDLYVADINIAITKGPYERRAQCSVSASRRSSNMDLSPYSPQINVINPTPLPQMTDRAPSFTRDLATTPSMPPKQDRQRSYSRDFTPLRSTSPPAGNGFRKAKPPMSVDYMRPDENKKNLAFYRPAGEVLPQNRPIDMSKYKTSPDASTTVEPIQQGFTPIQKPTETLQQTVAELEAIHASQNIENIRDNIQIQRLSPPLVSEVPSVPLNVDEHTNININTKMQLVDIDKMVKEEQENARNRAKSPTRYLESLARQDKEVTSRGKSPMRQDDSLKSRGRSPMSHLDILAREDQEARSRGRSPLKQYGSLRSRGRSPMSHFDTLAKEDQEAIIRGQSPMRQEDSLGSRGTSPMRQEDSLRSRGRSPIKHLHILAREDQETTSSDRTPSRNLDTLAREDQQSRNRGRSPARHLDIFTRGEQEAKSLGRSPTRHLDALAREDQQSRTRAISPTRERLPTDNLQLPEANSHQLKRGHSPERQPSPTRSKKSILDTNTSQVNGDATKTSYTTMVKNFFSQKPKEDAMPPYTTREKSPSPAPSTSRFTSMFSREKTPQREKSPTPAAPPTTSKFSSMFSREKTPMREKSPSPAPQQPPAPTTSKFSSIFSKEKTTTREKSPSPNPTTSKFMSMFSKEKPTAISVVSGTNAAVTNKSGAEPMSIKVIETFSLKVDEMDQYMTKPSQKQPAPNPPSSLSKTPSVPKSFDSREDFADSERLSIGVSEAFAPVIIGRSVAGSSQFLTDKHTSHSEMSSQDRGLEIRSCSKEPTIHHHPELQGKPLFSAPIMMDSSGSINQSISLDRRIQMRGVRSPSEQRPLLQYRDQKGDFFDGRTQSTDRQRLGGSQDNLYIARMSKTVSFNFDERKSRLTQFESGALPKKEIKHELLERANFSR